MRITRGVTAAAIGLMTLALGVGPALARTTRHKSTQSTTAAITSGGSVTATITYTQRAYYAAGLHLTITRAGQALYSANVTAPGACGTTCAVASAKALMATDVESNGEPVVTLDLYTGGAHCCYLTQFFTYDPGTETYVKYSHDWGDPGYRLKQLNGAYVFETTDDRFAYRFTDYAASGMPLALFRFNGTQLVNVTSQYPSLIASDAAAWLRAFRSQASSGWSDTVGVIAAWAADEDSLGRSAEVAKYLRSQAAAGHLKTALSGEATGVKFIKNLDLTLKRWGYLT